MSSVKTKVVRIGNSRGIRIPKVILDQYHINDEVDVKTKVVRIGNSRGIRIPKVILDQYHINDEVELETKEDCVIIKSSHIAREGWEKGIQKNA